MKTKIFILTVMLLIPISFSVQPLYAQAKTKEQEQEELKLKQEIDSQKKAMLDRRRAIDGNASQDARTFDYNGINGFMLGRPYGGDLPQALDHFASGRTSWDFAKSITEATFTKEYGIDVDKGSKNVSLSISGTCMTGEIRIAILMPGDKPFSEAVIDEFGNLNWRKSLQIAEDNTDKIGEWKFKISAKSATGNFNISLQVN